MASPGGSTQTSEFYRIMKAGMTSMTLLFVVP